MLSAIRTGLLNMASTKTSRMLGLAAGAILMLTLFAGLWPYPLPSAAEFVDWLSSPRLPRSLLPDNEVKWVENGRGLQFGEHGNIFSESEFRSLHGTNCSLELWIEPTSTESHTTLLAFSKRDNPLSFRVRQIRNQLGIIRHAPGEVENYENETFWADDALHRGQWTLITLSSDENGTRLYLNGELFRQSAAFRIELADVEGTLVVGDAPTGHDTWTGIVGGLAVYAGALSAEKARDHFRKWKLSEMIPLDTDPETTALYLFNESAGQKVRSAVPGAPALSIRSELRNVRPTFLKPFWLERGRPMEYWSDVAVNVAGFVPLGFVLGAYLSGFYTERTTILLTALFGFLVSLTIEVLQYFLPLRSSGTTDLITNAAGALAGALLGASAVGRGLLAGVERRIQDWDKNLPLRGK